MLHLEPIERIALIQENISMIDYIMYGFESGGYGHEGETIEDIIRRSIKYTEEN